MWLVQFVCAPQFFKTPKGLCGHTVHITREKFTTVLCLRIRWRIRRGHHGDMIFDMILASHLTELNLCWSRPIRNLTLSYQLSMRPVTSHRLSGQQTVNYVKSRSGNGQKSTDPDHGFGGTKIPSARICPRLKGLAICRSPPQKIYRMSWGFILSELTLYSVWLIYWTTLPIAKII
jgi:hypothetical protein